MKHIVQLTLSNPSHEHVSLRARTKQQNYIAEARDESEAINRATRHFRTLGFKVHSAVIVEQKVELPEPVKAEPLSEAVDYKALEKPTIARIKSGETKPVDKTDYDKPAYLRKKPVDKKAALEAYIARRKETAVVTEEAAPQYIEEKLTAADPASKWISDFVKSDNPKFAGKSKAERIKMALGAKYATKNEEVEQVDEARVNHREFASDGVMHPDMANAKYMKPGNHIDFYSSKNGDKLYGKVLKNDGKNVHIDHKGEVHKFRVSATAPHQMKEEVEQVDEAGQKVPVPIAPVPARKYIKGTPENKAAKEAMKPRVGHPTNLKKEEVEQTDEETKQRKSSVAGDKVGRLAFRAQTGAEVNKNHVKIYKNLKSKDPEKAKNFKAKFLPNMGEEIDQVEEAADPGETKVVNKAVKTKKAAAAADKLVKIAKSKVNKINMDPKLDHDVKQSSRY